MGATKGFQTDADERIQSSLAGGRKTNLELAIPSFPPRPPSYAMSRSSGDPRVVLEWDGTDPSLPFTGEDHIAHGSILRGFLSLHLLCSAREDDRDQVFPLPLSTWPFLGYTVRAKNYPLLAALTSLDSTWLAEHCHPSVLRQLCQ